LRYKLFRTRRKTMKIPTASADTAETLEFLRLVWALDHTLAVASKRMRTRLGVTGPQRVALRLIGESPRIGAGELARAMVLHPSTVTGIVDRLVDGNLVSRDTHPDDRRRQQLTLTPAGERLVLRRDGTVEEAVRSALATLGPVDSVAVRKSLRVLIDALGGEDAE
jgi:DNA-binding MarR family transcriptional regulator